MFINLPTTQGSIRFIIPKQLSCQTVGLLEFPARPRPSCNRCTRERERDRQLQLPARLTRQWLTVALVVLTSPVVATSRPWWCVTVWCPSPGQTSPVSPPTWCGSDLRTDSWVTATRATRRAFFYIPIQYQLVHCEIEQRRLNTKITMSFSATPSGLALGNVENLIYISLQYFLTATVSVTLLARVSPSDVTSCSSQCDQLRWQLEDRNVCCLTYQLLVTVMTSRTSASPALMFALAQWSLSVSPHVANISTTSTTSTQLRSFNPHSCMSSPSWSVLFHPLIRLFVLNVGTDSLYRYSQST